MGFLNTYIRSAYAVCLKTLSTKQHYNMANRKYVKYNLRFYFCPCFWEKALLPLLNHPLLPLSCWPLVSVTLSTKLMQVSNWYVRQYSTMSNKVIQSKETNIIFKMTVFCDDEDVSSSQWMKCKEVTKITCTYLLWQCFYSLINVTLKWHLCTLQGIWIKEGTAPNIINLVLVHTMPYSNLLATQTWFTTILIYKQRNPSLQQEVTKMVKTSQHVNIIGKTLHKNKFNHHGLHLNTKGKERIIKLVRQSITNSLIRKNNLPISLPWKEDPLDPAPNETASSSTNECTWLA